VRRRRVQGPSPQGGGRIRASKGFTLIELLIVVLIIGILAAIAIPKFGATKNKAYVAALKSDLRNLVTAEELYFADNVTYTTSLSTTVFQPTSGVTVTIGAATVGGWNATATHTALATTVCAIFSGTGPPVSNAIIPGEVKCQ
jgi:prepilin-type N-terminal cleavage/methylation domain-containing protein